MPTTLGSDARDIARMVSVPQMLRHFRWRGRSTETGAYQEEIARFVEGAK
jgi:hypothetical protein